jgi:hypothetical protein
MGQDKDTLDQPTYPIRYDQANEEEIPIDESSKWLDG